MSDNYTEPEDDDGEDFKNLRAKARKADALERENQTLKRENAFIKAGIPLEDPRMGYFVKGYDGELDPQSIKQAAIEAGFIQPPPQVADPAVDQARAGQQRVMAASTGAESVDDEVGVMYRMEQAYSEGGLEGLSAVAEQFGVTFRETPV